MIDQKTKQEVEKLASESGGIVSVTVRNISNAYDYSFNDKVVMGSASTIKVPIIVEAMKQVKAGKLALDKEYKFTSDMFCPGSGVLSQLHSGLMLTLNDLMTLMIIVSDNAATNCMIDIVGMDSVNATMKSFGYNGISLQRKMYDHSKLVQNLDNYIVASEMADLLYKIANGNAVGDGYDQKIINIMLGQQIDDRIPLFLPSNLKVANKTGNRSDVMHDSAIIYGDNFTYTTAVFTKGIDNYGDSRVLIGKIARLIYEDILAKNS